LSKFYAIIGVEGPQDQAFVGKVLKLLGFKDFRDASKGLESQLDPFWRKFIPTYPRGNLYQRLAMPSILFTDTTSVVIYAGEGSNLIVNLDDILSSNIEYQTQLGAFAIVADCDTKVSSQIAAEYSNRFRTYFPNFPDQAGIVDKNSPLTGIYVLPDNVSQGVLDTLLCSCGEVAYPEYINRARSYLDSFSEEEKKKPLKWKPFDENKALIATIVSVLKPGKTNTVSIADNNWISEQTQREVPSLGNFIEFLRQLLAVN
jgi:hypothetical protein